MEYRVEGVDREGGDQDQADHGYGKEHRSRSPLHDWRLKAAIQTVLSHLPRPERLNYVLQRHVTRTLPVSDEELVGQVAKARRNLDAYRRHGSKALAECRLYEFGAGWDLLMPIAYYCMGVDHQTVVDIKPLARADLVADVAQRLAAAADRLDFARVPDVGGHRRSVSEMAAALGIDYRAPADARSLDLPDASIDLVTSCDVLEHVPPADISAILIECRRLLRDDGIARMRVDYQDHYWYFDERISPYNFLRYDERTWRRFNPALHYQNRMRHDALKDLVTAAGWTILEDDAHRPSPEDVGMVAALPPARPFRSQPLERLAVRYANLTMSKATFAERR